MTREHDEENYDCWCKPEILVVEDEDGEEALVIVHNDVTVH